MKTNLKKILSIAGIIFALMLLSAFSSFATDLEDDGRTGECGEGSDVYWEIVPNEDGTEDSPKYSMYISGTGTTFQNLKADGKPVSYSTPNETKWETYRKKITRVYIGDNVTTLGSCSFIFHTAIHTVELGANVTTLGSAAFEGCNELKTIYRKGNTPVTGTFDLTGITSMGSFLFDGCRYVDTIILPTTGSYNLNMEFLKENYSLKTLYIPKACKSISALALRNCSALETIYIEGDPIISEGEVTKGSEGTFYAYAFHNCGVKNGEVRSFSISAVEGSQAHQYALSNAEHSITEKDTTTYYTIDYIKPYDITVIENGNELIKQQVVYGFAMDYELIIDDSSYIIFSDEKCNTLMTDTVTGNKTVYARKVFDFLGYMVRVKDYHGLRAIYEYNSEAFKNLENFSVVEAGVLGASLYGVDPILDLDYGEAIKTVIYSGETLVGKLISLPKDGVVSFANVAVGFENDGTIVPSRVANRLLSRAYVTLKNDTTGETFTYYSVQGTKDLTAACEATKAKGTDILDAEENAFLDDLIALGVDPDYIYTKEEAMEHLTAVYNDPDHILSGQHIGYSRYTVRNNLNNIYNKTGELPAVLSYDVAVAYRSPGYGEEANTVIADDFAEYAKQGGLISMCAHLTNPEPEQLFNNDPYRGTLTLSQWDLLFEEGNYINENFMTELEAIADFLQMMKDRGLTIFWRPMHETNGAFFWFCGASVPKDGNGNDVSVEYAKRLWIFMYEYLVNERGLDNLIWVYSPNIAPDGNKSSPCDVMKYYPGDDYVDVMGIDWYNKSDTMNGAEPTILTKDYDTSWYRLAGKYTGTEYTDFPTTTKQMPVVYGEFGPANDLRNPDASLSYNGEDCLDLVTKVANAGLNMGWIVFWSGWTDNWISLDLMDKTDVFMQSEMILDLKEARNLLLEMHYGK